MSGFCEDCKWAVAYPEPGEPPPKPKHSKALIHRLGLARDVRYEWACNDWVDWRTRELWHRSYLNCEARPRHEHVSKMHSCGLFEPIGEVD